MVRCFPMVGEPLAEVSAEGPSREAFAGVEGRRRWKELATRPTLLGL